MLQRFLVATTVLLAATAPRADAQLVVRVESNGIGVYAAEVSVWSDSGRLASGRTDGAGIVRFGFDRTAGATGFVTARRLGFAPGRVPWQAADSVTIELAPHAAELPTLAVSAKTLRCPAGPEERAEQLWKLAAAHYSGGQDTMPFGYLGAWDEERVPRDERGFGDPPRQRVLGGSVSWAKVYRVSPHPYGSYDRRVPTFGPAYDWWRYSPLHNKTAWHFATGNFFDRHTLVVLGQSGTSTIVGFCPRARDEPEIEGELEIGADTLLRGARWSFHVPHDDDGAGGEATFGTGRLDGATYLVAVRGTFWRRAGRQFYDQERFVLDAWKFGHTPEQAWLGTWNAQGDRSGTPRP